MAERPRLLYIVVHDEEEEDAPPAGEEQQEQEQAPAPAAIGDPRKFPPRYTRSLLQSTLQLMGCKARHAFKISDRAFDVFENEERVRRTALSRQHSGVGGAANACECAEKEQAELDCRAAECSDGERGSSRPSRKRATAAVSRDRFLNVVCHALAEYQYVGPNQRADLSLACRVREKKTSVTVLLCGTSGCGKSTLSSLLASRLGITTVVSTDSVRHMMRSFVSEKENSLLWASTYHAGECLDLLAVAKAKMKKNGDTTPSLSRQTSSVDGKSGSLPGSYTSSASSMDDREGKDRSDGEETASCEGRRNACEEDKCEIASDAREGATAAEGTDAMVGTKTIVVQGFKAQSEMVIDSLDRLITAWERKNESVVIEGVHLSLNFVMGLMKNHPSIVPFMVYISNEGKHLERFAVRAKYMTLDPAKNKYVKYIQNIRTIQEYLCKRADKHLVPKVNNTNVDKSIALIHATVFSCLRRRMGGEPLCDQATNTVKVVDQEYRSQCAASSLGSKGMFQLIQRRGSSRHLMALMNTDGSVAKAWLIESDSSGKQVSGSSNGSKSGLGTPVYGPLPIGKSEPVNLQFGSFGLSAWLTDTGAASYAVSVNSSADGQSSRGECEMSSSCPDSSCSSSPKCCEGGDKELIEEVAVSGSDEEPEEEPREVDSDEEEAINSGLELMGEDDGGSVDDQSERSDENSEDFDGGRPTDDAFWSEEAEDEGDRQDRLPGDGHGAEGDEVSTLPSGRMGENLRLLRYRDSHRRGQGGRFSSKFEILPFGSAYGRPRRTDMSSDRAVSKRNSHKRSKSFPSLDT